MASCVIVMAGSNRVGREKARITSEEPGSPGTDYDGMGTKMRPCVGENTDYRVGMTRGGRERNMCRIGISYVSPQGEGLLMGPTMAEGGRGGGGQ